MKTIKSFLVISFIVMAFINQVNGQTNTSTGTNAGSGGVHNSAYGFHTLTNTTGGYNSAFGSGALQYNTSGQYNVGIGRYSMFSNLSGNHNIGVGMFALKSNTTASGNISIGYNSLANKLAGGGNIAIGHWAASALTSGTKNILIGSNLAVPDNLEYSIVLGNNSSWKITSDANGYTGIGLGYNQFAENRLEIGATAIPGTAGLRFSSIDSGSPTVLSNGKVLTVNSEGDVVLTTDVGGIGGGSSVNIYNADDTLTGHRTVYMNDNRMMFDIGQNEGGAIYIGKPTPVTDLSNYPKDSGEYRLYVEGGILTEKVKVALRSDPANWADYVFEDDYRLMPLSDVESFIKTNKHLPGITSAEDLFANGLDLAQMQAKQMEKIEELTLYIIEQDKTVKQLSEEVEALKTMVTNLLNKSN